MKKLVVALLLLFASVDAYPQLGFGIGGGGFGMGMRVPLNKNNGPQRSRTIENQVQRMKRDLNLDKDQVIDLRGLLVERDRRSNSKPLPPQEFNQRLEKILTPEQLAMLKEKRAQRHQQKQNKQENKTPPAPEDNPDDVYN